MIMAVNSGVMAEVVVNLPMANQGDWQTRFLEVPPI